MIRVGVSQRDARQRGLSRRDTVRLVTAVLRGERIRNAEVSIVFVGNRFIRPLNRGFLHHDRVTDVITFPLSPPPELEAEVYVNVEQAKRQAAEYRVSRREELTRLVVHGVLHSAGYRDGRTKERQRMFERQERYVGRLLAPRPRRKPFREKGGAP